MNERGTWSRQHVYVKNVKTESTEMPPHRTDVQSKVEEDVGERKNEDEEKKKAEKGQIKCSPASSSV